MVFIGLLLFWLGAKTSDKCPRRGDGEGGGGGGWEGEGRGEGGGEGEVGKGGDNVGWEGGGDDRGGQDQRRVQEGRRSRVAEAAERRANGTQGGLSLKARAGLEERRRRDEVRLYALFKGFYSMAISARLRTVYEYINA
jgi:hypothetical protein